MTKVEEIDISGGDMTEDTFVAKAVELIGELKKNDNKTLHKDTFIKIFKYTGDFAKLRSKDLKQKAQEKRTVHFGVDTKLYLEAL
jgi:hypothetical protein